MKLHKLEALKIVVCAILAVVFIFGSIAVDSILGKKRSESASEAVRDVDTSQTITWSSEYRTTL